MTPDDRRYSTEHEWAKVDGGEVTVWVTKSEMGQGVHTALPVLVAEELDADFSRIRIEQAIANPNYGGQLTGVSRGARTAPR